MDAGAIFDRCIRRWCDLGIVALVFHGLRVHVAVFPGRDVITEARMRMRVTSADQLQAPAVGKQFLLEPVNTIHAQEFSAVQRIGGSESTLIEDCSGDRSIVLKRAAQRQAGCPISVGLSSIQR
jgi:hypothetical protein